MKDRKALHLPVSLDLRNKPVLLVGGGDVAFRKARVLAESGCRLTVVARSFSPSFRVWLEKHECTMEQRPYREGEAAGYFLVVCATDETETNQRAFRDADRAGRLVNVADQPALCNVHVPSVLRRGNLQVAVSTGGACPSFARWVRQELEGTIPERYGPLLERMALIRSLVRAKVPSPDARRRVLERLVASRAVRTFLSGDESLIDRMIEGWKRAKPPTHSQPAETTPDPGGRTGTSSNS